MTNSFMATRNKINVINISIHMFIYSNKQKSWMRKEKYNNPLWPSNREVIWNDLFGSSVEESFKHRLRRIIVFWMMTLKEN